jgi:CheY-like chemotaxis protein
VDGEYTVEAYVERHNRRSSPRRAKKVLVIDDDPNILFALEETVRHLGHDCVSACDAEDGLVMAKGIRPDLIITDILMPKFDGFELCHRLKDNPGTRDTPVIIVTARDRKKDADQAWEVGAKAFLVKPFRARDLSGHIDRILTSLSP